ncbi:hypothetical protein MMAG44476_34721 [Mycolicibacterium mageritense DSM 44476 = CIP 104973]
MAQDDGISTDEALIKILTEQRNARHRCSVAFGIKSACANDSLEILGRERLRQQDMCACHASVQVAHSGLVRFRRLKSIGKIVSVFGLFTGLQVLHCVDELGATQLGDGHVGERQNLELIPACLDPHDVAIFEVHDARRRFEPMQ